MKAAIPLFALSALAVIGIVLLTINGDPVPDVLGIIAAAAVTGGAGVTQHHPAGVTIDPPATVTVGGSAPGNDLYVGQHDIGADLPTTDLTGG